MAAQGRPRWPAFVSGRDTLSRTLPPHTCPATLLYSLTAFHHMLLAGILALLDSLYTWPHSVDCISSCVHQSGDNILPSETAGQWIIDRVPHAPLAYMYHPYSSVVALCLQLDLEGMTSRPIHATSYMPSDVGLTVLSTLQTIYNDTLLASPGMARQVRQCRVSSGHDLSQGHFASTHFSLSGIIGEG